MLSVVILTFNSIKFIKPCLDSVFSQDLEGTEIIVVDNASKDGTVNFIKENYPQVILIENKENLGAARARNLGIGVVKGDWILTLDCDVILGNDFFKKTMAFIKDLNDKTGMFQPKILNTNRKTIYSCGIYLSRLRRFYDIGKGQHNNGKFNTSKYIFGACSAAAFYKRQMLDEVREETGYFDERFFFLIEDVDLSWRAQKKGWKAIFYPEAVCYHSGDSSNTSKKIRQYLCFRNRYFTIFKNEKNIFFPKLAYSLLTYDIPRMGYFLFANNKFGIKALKEILQFFKSLR